MFSSWSPGAHDLLCYISQWPASAHSSLAVQTCLHSNGHIRWMSPKPRWTRQLSCPLTVTSLLEYCAVTVGYYWVRKLTRNLDMNWQWIPFWFREMDPTRCLACHRDLQRAVITCPFGPVMIISEITLRSVSCLPVHCEDTIYGLSREYLLDSIQC